MKKLFLCLLLMILVPFEAAMATCPSTLSGTYLGNVGSEHFTTTGTSATLFKKVNVRVRWVVESSTRSSTTTSGSFTFYNYYGGSGSKTGGDVTTTGTYTYNNSTCQGSYLTSDGETWVFSITDSGAEITAMMQSWTSSSGYPHASAGTFRKP